MSIYIISLDYTIFRNITLSLKNDKEVLLMDKKELNIAIGQRIRVLREAQGKTRDKLSEEAEISPHFLFEIETGKKSMTANTIVNIARALHVTTDFILLGEATPMSKIVNNLEGLMPEQLNLAEQFIETFSIGLHSRQKNKK